MKEKRFAVDTYSALKENSCGNSHKPVPVSYIEVREVRA